MTRCAIALCCVAGLALAAGKGNKPEPSKTAKVDWAHQVLRATGSGAPDVRASSAAQARLGAEMAAKMDAFRNLLAEARGIHISGSQTVGDAIAQDELRGRVEGVLRDYKVVAKRYFSDQGVEIDVEVPLTSLASAVVTAPRSSGAHTGLLIDARGLKVVPALMPRLLDGTGKAQVLSGSGTVGYFTNADEAKKSDKVGENPIWVKAISAKGSDLVLSPAEAESLLRSDNWILSEGRVAIVMDPQ